MKLWVLMLSVDGDWVLGHGFDTLNLRDGTEMLGVTEEGRSAGTIKEYDWLDQRF